MLGISLEQTRVYQEAKEEGIEEGIERGIEQGKMDVALNLLRRNFPVEEIAEITGLSIEQIQTLQAQSSTEPS